MSKEKKKKPKQGNEKGALKGQASAAIEAGNQPHNAKNEALGRNTKQG